MSFERCVAVEDEKTSSDSARAGVRSKRRQPILNGSSTKHVSVLKKKKKAVKSVLSPSQRLNSMTSVDDEDGVVDKKLCSEFVPDEEKSCSSPSPADKDSKRDSQAAQSTDLVRYSFVLTVLIN